MDIGELNIVQPFLLEMFVKCKQIYVIPVTVLDQGIYTNVEYLKSRFQFVIYTGHGPVNVLKIQIFVLV